MIMPKGTTFVIDGGEFYGTPPESCEIVGTARVNGVAVDSSICLGEDATLAEGSSLVMVNGAATIAEAEVAGRMICNGSKVAIDAALVVSGFFQCIGVAPFTAPALSVSGELVLGASATVRSLTTTNGAALTLQNARLSVATSANLDATTTISGVGVLELPRGTNRTGLTLARYSNVRILVYGLDLTWGWSATVIASNGGDGTGTASAVYVVDAQLIAPQSEV